MASNEKKTIISLPLKTILNQEGSTFFIKQNKKLLRFRLANNIEEYGISVTEFKPQSIQHLFLIGYISKIEVAKPEFASSRQELMDLSKLIVYSLLYKQYDSYIFHQILASDAIKKWNRLNPANIIDEKTNIKEKYLRSILVQNERFIDDTRHEILAPIYDFINKNSSLLPEEKNIQLLLSEKFLMNMRPFIWFILTKFKDAPNFEGIVKTIRSSLTEYMDKAKVAEYIALMLIELVANAENANVKKEAAEMFKGEVDMNMIMYDTNLRKKIVAELERKHELVSLSWKIGGGSTSIGTQGKLQIDIYNMEEHSETVQKSINDKKSSNLKEKSIAEFYGEGGDGSDLGLYYLSYLDEACEKVNVRFESNASQFDSDLSVINLSFAF